MGGYVKLQWQVVCESGFVSILLAITVLLAIAILLDKIDLGSTQCQINADLLLRKRLEDTV